MSVYFCCREECDDLTLDEPGVFSIRDALGRSWTCYSEVRRSLSDSLDLRKEVLRKMLLMSGRPDEPKREVYEIECENADVLEGLLGELRPANGNFAKVRVHGGAGRRINHFEVIWVTPQCKETERHLLRLTFQDGKVEELRIGDLERLRTMVSFLKDFNHVEYDTTTESLIFGHAEEKETAPAHV